MPDGSIYVGQKMARAGVQISVIYQQPYGLPFTKDTPMGNAWFDLHSCWIFQLVLYPGGYVHVGSHWMVSSFLVNRNHFDMYPSH